MVTSPTVISKLVPELVYPLPPKGFVISYLLSAPAFVAVQVNDELSAPAVLEKVQVLAKAIELGKVITIFGVSEALFTNGLAISKNLELIVNV